MLRSRQRHRRKNGVGDVKLTPRIGWYGLIKVSIDDVVQLDVELMMWLWIRVDPIDILSSRLRYEHCCQRLALMRQWKVTAQGL